jgi:hypothetical protein
MRECPHCGRRASALDRFCSTCSTPLAAEQDHRELPDDASEASFDFDDASLAPIARFLNAAEAGYFAHELRLRERVPVFMTAEESFDAVAGYWTTRFLLCVPQESAPRTAEVLQQLVNESESDDVASAPRAQAGHDAWHAAAEPVLSGPSPTLGEAREPLGVGWVPLVLTLAAGSAAFWGVRPDAPPRPPAAPAKRQEVDQWNRLPVPMRPWTFRHENGRGQRQFFLETARRRATVREDADGDGIFESEQQHELPAR